MKPSRNAPPSWGDLLREALPEPPLPHGFVRSVMRRVRVEESPWVTVLRDVVLLVTRPASLGFLAVSLVVGGWGGWRRGFEASLARAERAHVLALDPESTAFMP